MTTQVEIPGVEPSQVEGAAGSEGTPAGTPEPGSTLEVEGSTSDTSESESGKSGDYLERIRSDAEFAVEEIRNKDRAVTAANQKAKRYETQYGRLDPVIEDLGGGDGVLQLLTRFNNLLLNPKAKKMVERFEQTGVVATVDDYSSDLDEPEETDPRDVKIQALEQRLNDVDHRQGRRDLNEHFIKLKEDFEKDWEELAPMMQEQLEKWERDPAATKLMSQITYDVLHTIALKKLYGTPEDRAKRGARDYGELLELRKQRATDMPSGVATTGNESLKGPKDMDVAQAFEQFNRETGNTRPIGLD